MSLEPKIMARLKAEVPLVGGRVNWPGALQGMATPYLVVAKISSDRDYTHDGYSGLSRPRYQVSVFAPAYVEAKQTAEEVIAAMESWKADGIRFAPVAGEQDFFVEAAGLYHVPVDFFIHYEE